MRFEIGDPASFVQSVTGFVALKPQAAGFPIEAFGKDVNVGRGAVFALTSRHPRTVLNGDPASFVQSVTGFVAPKPQAAGFPIEAFGKDVGREIFGCLPRSAQLICHRLPN